MKSRCEYRALLIKLCCFAFLILALLACRLSENSNSRSSGSGDDGPNAELCKKYESCGCITSYENCISQTRNDPNLEKPGVRECMLNSSCASLCAGRPDGCIGASSEGGTTTPQRSNCASISCSKASDCPADCYGGCDGVRCYSF